MWWYFWSILKYFHPFIVGKGCNRHVNHRWRTSVQIQILIDPDLRGFPMSSSPGKDSPMHVADNFSLFFSKNDLMVTWFLKFSKPSCFFQTSQGLINGFLDVSLELPPFLVFCWTSCRGMKIQNLSEICILDSLFLAYLLAFMLADLHSFSVTCVLRSFLFSRSLASLTS